MHGKLDKAFIASFEKKSKAGVMKPVYLDGPPGDHISLLKRVHNACNASCPTFLPYLCIFEPVLRTHCNVILNVQSPCIPEKQWSKASWSIMSP